MNIWNIYENQKGYSSTEPRPACSEAADYRRSIQ